MKGRVAIIGGGFGGLAAAWELTRHGVTPIVLEADDAVGGLAGSFHVNGERLERFYHHWFTSDTHVAELARELGTEDRIVYRSTRTGLYFANKVFRLSSPLDVLRFTPLSPVARVRLGMLALRARAVKNWRALEKLTAREWLVQLGGREVFDVVWRPLLEGKFGPYAGEVSAVWFWNKLKLRGGSRSKGGRESLAYYRGGFATLAEQLATAIRDAGGEVRTREPVRKLLVGDDGRVLGVRTDRESIPADAVLATTALPIVADLVQPHAPAEYVKRLHRIPYLANLCIVLELDRSLSNTYWLNVNDPGFPFVGIIEHTNFEPASTYAGRHIVYLSKYLPADSALYAMRDDALLEFCIPHLQRMFPRFDRSWIRAHHVWRAEYAQPVVVRQYSALVPSTTTPLDGLFLCSMAQVYPEDRGTNYAVREGRRVGGTIARALATRARAMPREVSASQ
ncbi:MAG TPA: NAD(P)/FAD-dependent oxidoreductase [Gemmatimonadaceae bacterium]|nr:NAD(P)/FAD-dependent oxidoreductase [Gemmatimonadaceae bacterium]